MATRSLFHKSFRQLFGKSRVSPGEPFFHPSPALFSTHVVGDTPVLVRDFIRSALYDPNVGYFSQRSGSVGLLENNINFNRLQGRKAYMRHLDIVYKQNDISWFTPVELFKPWYAHGIAEAIMRTADLSIPLKIYEIGGGSGTCAKGIMDYIMLNAPTRVYNNMTYISVEISSSLAKKQLDTVGEVRSHLSKFRVENRDAADPSGWGVEEQPCWVIMLEVLDNLPHDVIYSENQVSPWLEVWVEKKKDRSELSELYKPLQDPFIRKCMEIMALDTDHTAQGDRKASIARRIWASVLPKPRRHWLPTGCLKLLEVLHGALPKMSLIASDFSYLPDVKIPGEGAPLVSVKKDGISSDYSNYLLAKMLVVDKNTGTIPCRMVFEFYPWPMGLAQKPLYPNGDADIFFPTDFLLLESMDHYCSGWLKLHKDKLSKKGKKRRTITLDTCSFFEEFGLPSKTRTKDGYNPLLDDFRNTKIYLSVPTHNTK